ncbi:hypothetical protein IMSAG249_00390 [Lachnospiraceae bacterium]|nr:hypothetical protein IMSAG249_00390 [Lachnospiraceae bacterium]
MKMQKLIILRDMILTLLFSIGVGFVIMLAVYLLPAGPMKANMQKCTDVLKNEGRYPLLIEGYKSTRLDNYTDAIMILTALYEDEEKNIAEKAMGNYRVIYDNMNPVEMLTSYLEGNVSDDVIDYPRYWHGYLAVIKPVLLLFDYTDIRVFNMIIQGLLLIYIIILMNEDKRLRNYIIPFIASIFVTNPYTISYSMQYSSVYYIILVSTIVLIKKKDKFLAERSKFVIFFMIVGSMTSFLDLLTWPLATCGFALVLALIIIDEKMPTKIILVIKYSVSWGIGYIGMWAGNWLISSAVLNKNIIKDAINEIVIRASNNILGEDAYTVTLKEVVRNQFFPILKWPYAILLLLVVVYLCCKLLKGIQSENGCFKERVLQSVPFLCVCILPFIWCVFSKNHSYLHYTFTWRILSVTIFSGLSMIAGEIR